jgi:3-phosphoshikimate 1-carboxyvinyltransferase
MKEIKPRAQINATVRIPGSKSVTHRALIASALAQGKSLLKEFLACEDTLHTVNALRALGISVEIEGEDVFVSGLGGDFTPTPKRREIYLGNSGTSYRLLLSTFALAQGEYLITGTPRMLQRPIGDLVKALNVLGVEAECIDQEGFPPVLIKAKGVPGGNVAIPGDKSSQYVSSLLLCGPYTEKGVEIEISGDLVSRPYVDVTLDVMRTFGAQVKREDYRQFRVEGGRKYQPCEFVIDGDVSSASYFWAAAAVTMGSVTTENIHHDTTRQGDIGLLEILEKMGCRVVRRADNVTVEGEKLSPIDVDMAAMPDMVPTLAAVALFADGKTMIRNVAHLRHKESDRLGDLAAEWQKMGAHIEVLEDGLVIQGGERLSAAVLNPHDDHRLAMSAAVVGLKTPGIKIEDPECVYKSFPHFWELWDKL